MTDVFTNRTLDYDGSPSGANDVYTAGGSIIVTFSGSAGSGPKGVTLMSRAGSADYVFTMHKSGLGRYRINMASGDEFYFQAQIPSDGSLDLNWVDV